jgi:hypothetical protein
MIAWALYVGKSGRGKTAHAFDTESFRRPGNWRQAVCGKWARMAWLDLQPSADSQRCRDCHKIEADTGKFSKWGAGR